MMTARLIPATTDVVVLCGGRGRRLGTLSAQTPKPLLEVAGHPFLFHLLVQMKREGFRRVILAAHYLAEQFWAFIATYQGLVPELELIVEPRPLGTGGALRYAAEAVSSSACVVLNGDTWVSQPVAPAQKGVWSVGADHRVLGFTTQESVSDGWVNAGMYIFNRILIGSWPQGRCYSLEDNLPALLSGQRAALFYSEGRLLDIGTPACYALASRILESAAPPVPALDS
jgi:NDP-sugar pyrophosphorylase family protein